MPETWNDDMTEAPVDRHLMVETDTREGLPSFTTLARWHPDAGFCVDEIRRVVRWRHPNPGEEMRLAMQLDDLWGDQA